MAWSQIVIYVISITSFLWKRKLSNKPPRLPSSKLISTFHVLQKFGDKIKTEDVVELDDGNLESFEPEMEIEDNLKDALVQLDAFLNGWTPRYKKRNRALYF